MKNVLEYLEDSSKKYSDKIAVVDDKEKCTYKQLQEMSERIGSVLSGYISLQEPVAVMMKKSVCTLKLFFGTVYAGGFYSLIDPDFPAERISGMLGSLKPKVVITSEDCEEKLKQAGFEGKIINADELMKDAKEANERQNIAEIREETKKNAPLYCNFTSGSTGVPKGVLVGHDTVISFIDDFTEMFEITSEDVIGNQAPFDFDVSVKDIYSAIKVGATLVIIPTAYFRMPNQVMDMLEEYKVTTLIWAVSALVLLNRLHEFMYKVPPYINKILFSGEEMPIKHLSDWMKQYPNATFVNLYGPTEITCNCTWYKIDREFSQDEKIPMGNPFPKKDVALRSEDGELISPKDEEKIGEVCVSGYCLAIGYYNNPEATKAAFVEDEKLFGEKRRIYKTGDLAYYKDGLLYFGGRKDFQIKHNGHRIELEEIERAMNSLEPVHQCACIYDEAKQRIVAFYTGEDNKKEIVAGLKTKVPAYMIPNVFMFVMDFPLTKNGKVDRKNLREMYLNRRKR